MKKAGVLVAAGVDVDPVCRFPYERNNGAQFLLHDVATLRPQQLANLYPGSGHRVLVGCAPCQPFSRYARGHRPMDQNRWRLLGHFSSLVVATLPTVVSMENVPELQHEDTFKRFVGQLADAGYAVTYQNVFCPDYGIPQRRTRLVLLASLRGPIEFEAPTHAPSNYRTVRETIGGLTPMRAGQNSRTDPMHRSSRLSDLNLQRIRHSRPGGCWREWPKELVTECHRQKSGETYPSVYGRMEWDKPAPTVTTQFFGYGNGRFGHPTQHRAISLREGALLQSFPKDYEFAPRNCPLSFATVGRLIGNAVPVALGEAIGRSIITHLETTK